MRPSFKSLFRARRRAFLTATLIVSALLSPALKPLAQDSKQVTRPRRATPTTQTDAWPTPTPDDTVTLPTIEPPATNAKIDFKTEPLVRVGLATNARSVTVSTNGHLLNATDTSAAPIPFDVARVRIEPRSYPPLPTPDANADLIETASSSSTQTPARGPSNPTGVRGNVQLTSRASAPVRGAAVYATGTTRPLLDVRAPVVFASDDEEQSPVRFNEKPYRGRIEVFANTRGSLTVVNVIQLEDYVRGVVPNELSPGRWPEIEALKAQAVAARTYALSHLGGYASEGFDVTPDTYSQVYGGRSTEQVLTDRAVADTRGRVATYAGRPIDALYTSTCGGRTEDAENVFGGEAIPYLRGRECALEGGEHFAPFTVRTSRELQSIRLAEHTTSARDAALLAVAGFSLPERVNDEWLGNFISTDEVREMLTRVASLAHQPTPQVMLDATRPAGFATALAFALDGESHGSVLLNSADVEYILSFRDESDIPAQSRADVAAMIRDGHLSLYPDGTLRTRQVLTRARVIHSLAHALEARGLLRLQKATARPSMKESLLLRPTSGKELNLRVAADAYLFAGIGEGLYPVRELRFVGGEPVVYHLNSSFEIDYLEARPSPSGAAADHTSSYANWAKTLTPGEVASRNQRVVAGLGQLLDLRVRKRGVSGRVIDLELIGSESTAHIRGRRIHTALDLPELLFVIERTFDDSGRVSRFTFKGRGLGHGVGLCQVGAYGLARAGLSYEKILKSYYTGISLTKLY